LKFLKITFFLLLTQQLLAEKVEITSTFMEAENAKKEVHFIGNAKVKKLNDWLHADEIIVYFDENNETKRYDALGNVSFEFKDEKKFYKGSANKVTYHPKESLYVLTGKAIVDDLLNKRNVKGDEITLNMLTGKTDVKGSEKKPVKFIFDMGKE